MAPTPSTPYPYLMVSYQLEAPLTSHIVRPWGPGLAVSGQVSLLDLAALRSQSQIMVYYGDHFV